MRHSLSVQAHSAWVCVAFSFLAAPSVFADGGEPSAVCHLSSTVPSAGTTTTFRVSNQQPGSLAVLGASGMGGPVLTGHPTLPVLCLAPSLSILGLGVIGADGLATFPVTAPMSGIAFRAQAVTVTGLGVWRASNCLSLVVDASSTGAFTDGSAGIDPTINPLATLASVDVDWADFDKDGCPDAFVATNGAGAFPLIYQGDCTGALTNVSGTALPSAALRPTSCLELGDLNGDSWPDLFLAGGFDASAPAEDLVLLNDTAGGFNAIAFTSAPGSCVDATMGDLDGDGDVDLVTVHLQDLEHPSETPSNVVLYLNQGGVQGGVEGFLVEDATFTIVSGSSAHGAGSASVALGDFDTDGDLDLFVGTGETQANGAQNQLWENDGTAVFSNVTMAALPLEPDNTYDLTVGDFDGDGDLDVFAANSISSDPTAVHLYENVSAGVMQFVDGSANVPASLGPVTNVRLAVDAADVDNDGDLDVMVAIHEIPAGPPPVTFGFTQLLLNQGGVQGGTQGAFAVDSAFGALVGPFIDGDVSFADVDGDGDMDAYIGNTGGIFDPSTADVLVINALL